MTFPFVAPLTRMSVERMPIMIQVHFVQPPPRLLVTSSSSFLTVPARDHVLCAIRNVTPPVLSQELAQFLLERTQPEPFSQALLDNAQGRYTEPLRVLFSEDTPACHPIRSSPRADVAAWLPPATGMLLFEHRVGLYALQSGDLQRGVALVMDPQATHMVAL
jgi:hypothetical protein